MTILKGLAGIGNLSEIERLEADWGYRYTNNNPSSEVGAGNYVPMLIEGDYDSNIPSNYDGYIMIFNEPEAPPPGGHPYTPQAAHAKYAARRNDYPNAKFVCGNVIGNTQLGWPWVEDFIDECNQASTTLPEVWGIHYYAWDIGGMQGQVGAMLGIVGGWFHDLVQTPIWITEIGCPAGSVEVFETQLNFFKRFDAKADEYEIERFAVFPVKLTDPPPAWFPGSWSVDMRLIDQDNDIITPMGAAFRDWDIDTDQVYMYPEPPKVWDGVSIPPSVGTPQGIPLSGYGVPFDAKAVILRFRGNANIVGPSSYFAFTGKEGDIAWLVRHEVEGDPPDGNGQSPTWEYDGRYAYYIASNNPSIIWSWCYLNLIGWVR